MDSLSARATAGAPLNMEVIVGPQLLGVIIAAMLFGIHTLQTYIYFQHFPRDRYFVKVMVTVVWVLEAAHMALVIAGLYQMAVINFGHPERFNTVPKTLSVSVFTTAGVYCIVPLFMIYRIKVLSGSWILVGVLAPLTIARSITSSVLAGISLATFSILEFSNKYQWLLTVSLTLGVVTDVLLSGLLVFLLGRKRGESKFRELNKIMDKLIVYTIESGLVTALFSLVNMIALLTMPHNWIWLGILVVVPKVYANSLLASLNGRLYVKRDGHVQFLSGSSGLHTTGAIGAQSSAVAFPPAQQSIQITKTSEMYVDGVGDRSSDRDDDLEMMKVGRGR